MTITITTEIRARGRRIFRAIRDQKRGWRINWKSLSIAYVVEAGIIISGFAAGLTFANKYAEDGITGQGTLQTASLAPTWFLPFFGGHSEAWKMAVIATLAFCLAEAVRLPLVHAFRTFPSYVWRAVFLIGIVTACGITVKSMSQVGEQMFHPRLRFVQDANQAILEAEGNLKTLQANKVADADTAVTQAEAERAVAQKRADEANARNAENNKNILAQGEAPKPRAEKYTYKSTCSNGKSGKKRKTWKCDKTGTRMVTDPWAGDVFTKQQPALQADIDSANVILKAAQDKLNGMTANTAKKAEIIAGQEKTVTQLKKDHLKAVADSQLHSFTGMVYGMDPRDVTDQQVHAFLRLFVFFPSIFVALASSILAMSAYVPVKRRYPDKVDLTLSEDGTIVRYVDDLVHNEATKTRRALNLGGQMPANAN